MHDFHADAAGLALTVLGPFAVRVDGRPIAVGGQQPSALLATLVASRGRRVSLDRLVDELWPVAAPPGAAHTVQALVSRLRKALGGDARLSYASGGYAFEVVSGVVDAWSFDAEAGELAEADEQRDPAAARQRLRRALDLWSGRAFEDFPDLPTARVEAVRLEALRRHVLDRFFRLSLDLGQHDAVLPELREAQLAEPLDEELAVHLTVALSRSGRRVEALDVLRRVRGELAEQLGLDPPVQLRQLERALLRDDPLPATDAPPAPGTAPRVDVMPGASPLLGREPQLRVLEQVVATGRSAVVLGEPGIGKTRLLRALARRLPPGVDVLWGAASDTEQPTPYLPFLQPLGRLVGDPALRQRLAGVAADLAVLFPAFGRPPEQPSSVELGQSRLRLFEAVSELLAQARAVRQGLVLVLDDLHWADPSTCQLLDHVLTRLSPGLSVLAACRAEALTGDGSLAGLAPTWLRNGIATSLELPPLDDVDITAIVMRVAAGAAPDVAERIAARAEGNPFLAEELAAQPAAETLPRTVTDMVARRLRRVPPAVVAVLEAASVLGPDLDVDLLPAVADLPVDLVDDALLAAAALRLLDLEPGGPRAGWHHGLSRQAVYEQIAPLRRRLLHGRCADQLGGAAPLQRARHLSAAGRTAEAALEWVNAGQDAFARRAFTEAAKMWQHAVDHLPEPVASELRRRTGDALDAAGQVDRAVPVLRAAVAGLSASGQPVAAAAARVSLGTCLWQVGEPDLARTELGLAAAALQDEPPSETRSLLVARLAGMAVFDHDGGRARLLAEEAVRLATLAGSASARLLGANYLGCALVLSGSVDAGIHRLDETAAEAAALGADRVAVIATYNGAVDRLLALRAREVPALADRITRLSPGPAHELIVGYLRAESSWFLGDLAAAEAACRAVREVAAARGARTFNDWAGELLAQVLVESGKAGETPLLLQRPLAGLERQDVTDWVIAHLRCLLGERELARARQEAQRVLVVHAGWISAWPHLLAVVVEALLADRRYPDLARARELVQAASTSGGGADPWLALARGRVLAAEADPDAVPVLLGALETFQSAGYRLDAGRTALTAARAANVTGDPALGKDLLRTAGRIAEATGSAVLCAGVRRVRRTPVVAASGQVTPGSRRPGPA